MPFPLEVELKALKEKNLFRQLKNAKPDGTAFITLDGKRFLNFASNNYLGLTHDSRVQRAAQAAVKKWGAGSGASRLVTGNFSIHEELERELASLKKEEAALCFSSGYLANLGAISALVGSGDLIVVDRYNHASLVDGARLSGAKLWVYKHANPDDLERILARATGFKRKLVVTDSYFSMDGDVAPLDKLLKVCRKHEAWLMVDEAHAVGVYGKTGAGLSEHFGLQGQIPVVMGTLSKALGSVGGYIAGSRTLREILINRAKSFIYTTGPSPSASAAAFEALRVVKKSGQLRKKLWENTAFVREKLVAHGFDLMGSQGPIIPVRFSDTAQALKVGEFLKSKGVFAPVIRPPTVPKGSDRIRVSVAAFHEKKQLQQLVDVFGKL